MTTIQQLRAMPIGQRIGGGFVLTVKMTKKSVKLPNKKYVHTVVLFDETGEMVADFADERAGIYQPIQKGWKIKIIVAEIQELVLKAGNDGIKLYVEQWQTLTQTLDEYEASLDAEALSYQTQWEREIKGKCRHGLVCSFIRAGKPIDKAEIEALVEYIMMGK